uniref:Uncharacterized protein n=1 Tax=Avena sativa TaxID=4498 RepID=A0ACD5XB46_AVESA
MEWRFFPKDTLPPRHSARIGRAMRGHIWWPNWMHGQIGVLDTKTFQFYLIDLPTSSTEDEHTYKIGETKDEKLCIVDINDNTLVSHFLTAGDADCVMEGWVLYKEFPLHSIVQEFAGCLNDEERSCVRVKLVAVIDGFVYLSIFYCKDTESCEVYLSLCLETSETSELFKGEYRHNENAHPYIMAWPPSLLQSKEESETELDDGPVGTKQGPSVLVAALQSLSQALMDDGDSNGRIVAELDAFLRPNVVDEGSLVSKITSLDAQLVTARDRILRISA